MSAADRTVDRAARCREASRALVNAIQQAAGDQDAERVAELTGLFRVVLADGLAPLLEDAGRGVTPESPEGRRLREVRDTAARDVTDLRASIPATGKVGDSPRVRDALKQLDELDLK
jgi:hypothetical protein